MIISNFEKDAVRALETYRNKDVVEKCFDDLKSEEDWSVFYQKSAD